MVAFREEKRNEAKEFSLQQEIKNRFRLEFLNWLDEMVFFNSLSVEVIRKVVVKELELFIRRIVREKNIKLVYGEEMKEKTLHEAYSIEYGVRPIKHYIEKKIGTLVGRGIVSQFLHVGGNYLLNLEKGTEEIKIVILPSLEQRKNLLKEKHE